METRTPIQLSPWADATVLTNGDWLLPLEPGQAVSPGWPSPTGPVGVTWHWAATWDLLTCSRVLGGKNPLRKGQASAHYAVGRSSQEGVNQYVTLENRSWHAGIEQLFRWDGQALTSPSEKASRTTVGVETITIGFARDGVPAQADWIEVDTPDGLTHLRVQPWTDEQVSLMIRHGCTRKCVRPSGVSTSIQSDGLTHLRVQPWTDEQVSLMIELGRDIVAKFPHIKPEHHHGHSDLCPTYKRDVLGFPFAKVLQGIYQDESLPDVWTPFRTVVDRQRALVTLGYDLGPSGADGDSGRRSRDALVKFHTDSGLPAQPYWTTFTCRMAYPKLHPVQGGTPPPPPPTV